jgi:DNA-binding NarL/FixJ family response regulator
MHMMTSILLADDHPYILHALADLLGRDRGFALVGSVADGEAALEGIRRLGPTIALLDVSMPGLSGLDVLRAVGKESLATRVVFLTAALDDAGILEAVAAGVSGLVLKQSAPDTLISCLLAVREGRKWLPSDLIDAALARETKRRAEALVIAELLTAREMEVVRLAAIGLPNKSIARELDVSEGTIKLHLHNIYTKLGVSNRTELAALALASAPPRNSVRPRT